MMTEENKLMAYAVRLLAGRRYHTVELRKKLRGRSGDEAQIETVIEKLLSLKYLDDGEYVRLYIQECLRQKPRGKRLIRNRLLQKGIPAAETDEQLNRMEMDEHTLAAEAARKKMLSLCGVPPEKQKNRLRMFLASRGFCSSAVISAVKTVFDPLQNQ